MKQRILLISGNFFPEPTGIGKYNLEMTEWLADNGYEVHVIATFPYYPYWQVQAPYQRKRKWYYREALSTNTGNIITIHRCPHYVPTKPSGIKRMLLDFTYCLMAFFQVLKFIGSRKKFDYVMTVVPPLPLGLLSILYKTSRGAKFLYHVQDLQIEAAKELQMIKSPLAIRSLFKMERYILKHADVVSSISDAMVTTIKNKISKMVEFFPNWVDTSVFYPIADKAALKLEFGFSPDDTIVLYSGSIGEKQGLQVVLESAAQQSNSKYKFVICGTGPYKEALQALAQSMQLTNVVFMPIQPIHSFNRFLNIADIHLIIQKHDASDLVMPSKLSTILAIGGVAVITANEGTYLHQLISSYNMGILVKAEDAEALTTGIHTAVFCQTDTIGMNASIYAQHHLSIDLVMKRFFSSALDSKKDQKVFQLQPPSVLLNKQTPLIRQIQG